MKKNSKLIKNSFIKSLLFLGVSVGFLATSSKCDNGVKNNDKNKPIAPKDNNSKESKKITPMTDQEFMDFVNGASDFYSTIDLNFVGSLSIKGDKTKIFPTEVAENKNNLVLTLKNNFKDKVNVEVVNIILDKDTSGGEPSNRLGEFTISVLFTNKSTKKTFIKQYRLSGFAKNQGFHHNGQISSDPTLSLQSDLKEYLKSNHKKRFELDNSKYIEKLKGQYQQGSSLDKVRPDLKISSNKMNEFNINAKSVGFDNYYEAALKGFTLPSYKDDGSFEGLRILDSLEVGKGPSWIDSYKKDHYKTNGLARTIPNEKYSDLAEQTFQVSFTSKYNFVKEINDAKNNIEVIKKWNDVKLQNYKDLLIKELESDLNSKFADLDKEYQSAHEQVKEAILKRKVEAQKQFETEKNKIQNMNKTDFIAIEENDIKKYEEKIREGKSFRSTSGTMWIMDFQKNASGATKWYFGTNSHVAKALTNQTTSFSMLRINENVGIGNTFRLSELDDNFTRFSFQNVSGLATKVFDGLDFMSTKPSNFLAMDQKEKYKDVEDFIDFAVIEIDFSKIDMNQFSVISNNKDLTHQYSGKNVQEIAKIITNNYETKIDKHIKFKSKSYLQDYSQIDRPLAIVTEEDKNKLNSIDNLFILGYPTAAEDYFLERYIDDDQLAVAKQNYSLWINSDYRYYKKLVSQEGTTSAFKKEELNRGNFLSYEIGYRSFIDKPGITDGFLAAHRFGKELYESDGKRYFNFGLEYLARFYTPAGGTSGSSVRNQHNEVLGVVHVSNNSAKTSLIAALRSEGYDYNNLFGSYKLPQYDLIYGGGVNQKSSYREAMYNKYSNISTALFPNGLDKIPNEFKFN